MRTPNQPYVMCNPSAEARPTTTGRSVATLLLTMMQVKVLLCCIVFVFVVAVCLTIPRRVALNVVVSDDDAMNNDDAVNMRRHVPRRALSLGQGSQLSDVTARPSQRLRDWSSVLSIVPINMTLCEEIQSESVKYTPSYVKKWRDMQAHWAQVSSKSKYAEGHSGQIEQQRALFYHLAKQNFVNTICETGFNGGHSAFQWLAAKTTNKVVSFDLARYKYTFAMAEYMSKLFPGRFTLIGGNSSDTIPAFSKKGIKCDLILIDGGHHFAEAYADFHNLRAMSSTTNLFIFDDYPSRLSAWYNEELHKVWTTVVGEGMVREVFSCIFKRDDRRGMTAGYFV